MSSFQMKPQVRAMDRRTQPKRTVTQRKRSETTLTKQQRRGRRSVRRDRADQTRLRQTTERIDNMHDTTRADLVHQLQKLSSDERAELMAEAAAENVAAAGKEAAAAALAELIRPTRKA